MNTVKLPIEAVQSSAMLPSATIKVKFNRELINGKVKELRELSNKIEYSKENIQWIAGFIENGRNIIKAINSVHKSGKAEALNICKQWDEAKKEALESVSFFTDVANRYTKLCADVEAEKRRLELEEKQNRGYLLSIESKMVEYAKGISECKDYKQLTWVERVINLDKARAAKGGFGKYSDVAVEKFEALTKNITEQKEIIKEIEVLKAGENIEELQEAIDETKQLLEEKRMEVQDTVVDEISTQKFQEAPKVFNTVKARRTTWKYEIDDLQTILKKSPNLLNITLDDSKVKEIQNKLKGDGKFEGVTEFVYNGIRFFEHKTY